MKSKADPVIDKVAEDGFSDDSGNDNDRAHQQRQTTKIVEPEWEDGDTVFIDIAGQRGSFAMKVVGEPKKDRVTQKWLYQLKEPKAANSALYQNGEWFEERLLGATKNR